MLSTLGALDLCGMLVTFCMMWPERDEITISVAAMFGLDTEEKIAKSAAALMVLTVLVWPITLKAMLEEHWPDA